VTLVQKAMALHESLTSTRAWAGGLIVALRRYGKRERLIGSALESLKPRAQNGCRRGAPVALSSNRQLNHDPPQRRKPRCL
jgi:hypothetical protein